MASLKSIQNTKANKNVIAYDYNDSVVAYDFNMDSVNVEAALVA
jgi:hypothetical protein